MRIWAYFNYHFLRRISIENGRVLENRAENVKILICVFPKFPAAIYYESNPDG